MKFEQLSEKERNGVKKYIKEELLHPQQKVKMSINPNEFNYHYKGNALHISGRLKDMDDRQMKSKAIKFLKSGLKHEKSNSMGTNN